MKRESEQQGMARPVTGRVCVTGGAGFVGRSILEALGDRRVRVLVRRRGGALGARSNVDIVEGDVTAPASLRGVFEGCEAVIHLVAIVEEKGQQTFDAVIRQGTVNVLEEAGRAGVSRFVHMSALGTRNDPRYGYFEAKWQAEQAVKQSGIPWTIFRPSVIFGPGDGFITTLANLVRRAPIIPVVGAGKVLFQPLALNELAAAYLRALEDPSTAYQCYDLGGGKTYTYEQIIDLIATRLGKKKPKVHLPVWLMKLVVALAKPLPKGLRPPVTSEQLKMLAIDNASRESATALLIGRKPMQLEDGMAYLTSGERGRERGYSM